MSEQYAREVLRRNVAQICQTIGWNGINSTPLDIMIHVLEKYIQTLGTQTNRYAEQFNRTEPNLNDLGLVFRDLNVQLPELAEFTRCVPSIAPPVSSERFPKPKESNLNFLKPGSHEVVTRPMHVHEHLPPMYPEKEQDTPAVAGTVEIRHNGIETVDGSSAVCPEVSTTDSPDKAKDPFKRPTDPVSLPANKRPRLRLEEEERTREISSVMMTMSGFLSPAREGKLPEARPPVIISEKHDKHKTNVHHSNAAKVPVLEKSDKKSKKNKLLNGKIMKSKRKDKSHKSDSGKNKDSKQSKYPPGFLKSKETHNIHNHLPPTNPKAPVTPKPAMPPPPVPVPELIRPVIKQEVLDPALMPKNIVSREDTIPVPRKIPISKSPLVSNPTPAPKNQTSTSTAASDIEIKKEVDEDVKLASQPDRSKINIFKRISNKSKEDKNSSDLITDKSPSTVTTPRLQDMIPNSENVRAKPEETIVVNNNDNNAVDLSKEMDLRAHEVISIDDDSLERNPALAFKNVNIDRPNLSLKQSLQVPYSKDVASISPKVKKEKKHKDKKDKAAKLEAKLLKKQQQQLAYEMAQTDKQTVRMQKAPKGSRAKNEPKMPQLPHGFPFFPSRNLIPGPGLIPNSGLIPGSDFLTGLANNPALRGLASPAANLLSNPYALSASGPGLIPGSGFLSGNLGSGLTNPVPMRHMANFPHSSRSSMTIPPMLRRPSLEVIPVDNDEDRHKSLGRDKERHDKHKSPTIPNILQKHKSKYKDNKPNLLKMPPVQPDITIELNPPKVEPVRQEPIKKPPPMKSPTPEPIIQPKLETSPTKPPMEVPPESENIEKKKDKSHKKEKKDKDSTKIKKKKDKKDKNKDKSEKKREKEEKHGLKDKIKKEKKEKKKEKPTDGVIPKLTLKLGSSNSNSPMPPSSPDVFKLNIKPVVKKDDNESSLIKEEDVSRDHSPSPELAQISALVTRPPKLKHLKHNHVGEEEPQSSPPPSVSSPPRKNRPPSSHSNSAKYKRILFKPLSKKSNFEDDTSSISEDTAAPTPDSTEPSGPLPTPYYLDEQGNKIWVCPACGRPDNGSPMIGCDGCDGWYHWVCVGITVEPGATEDWFCKLCKAKLAGKKRGRKPKGEKIRDCH